MPEVIKVPIINAAENAAEHVAIAAQEEEDVTWLTNRLDAHSAELVALRNEMQTQFNVLTEALRVNQDQARTMIESQTRMIETLTTNLSALTATALVSSRSNPDNLPSSSSEIPPNPEPNPAPVVVVEPEVIPANREEPGNGGKRKRPRM